MTPGVAFEAKATLGESPRWDAAAGALWWVDLPAGIVHRNEIRTGRHQMWNLAEPVSALLFDEDSCPLVACAGGIYTLPADGERRLAIAIEPGETNRLPNDAACDSRGRLWISTLDRSFRWGAGRLYRVADGRAEPMAGDFTIPNGIGFSPDERLMYVADSYQASIDVFDFDAAAGTVANRRRFTSVDPANGFPDGLCVDSDGAVWLALFGGGAVRRYSPEGAVIDGIDLPVTQVTSCTFGGACMDELFITTARMGDGRPLTAAELDAQPLAGDVFTVRTRVTGITPHCVARAHLTAGVGA